MKWMLVCVALAGCLNPNPYTEYFDVGIHQGSSACPNYRLYIHCN
jgi:hypothetical protein